MVKVNLLSSFPKPSTMKLASCNLINIPALLKHQDTMTILDLSNNKIAGDIPKWIWRIGTQILMNLNLSYNLFTHVEISMPVFFCNSQFSLIILDLSSNMLQGPIPPTPTRRFRLLKQQLPFFLSNSTSLTILIPPSTCHLQTIVL